MDDMVLTDNQYAMFEEDTDYYDQGISLFSANIDYTKHWPGGVIPYTISLRLSARRANITLEIKRLNKKFGPCIYFM